ncbi:MAG TPA: AAA family ATPase [Gaiellaceae bacterium]|nr:AAA family ATPase [Gaiellaceae bacterium]
MTSRPESLPQGTVTFLFTDIEGSTRLLDSLGRDRYGELLETHRQLLRSAIAADGGVEVDTEGDSVFAVFPSAGSALHAAVEAQHAFATRGWPGDAELRVRMGLHTGEASVAEQSYVGIAVHRARRVCDAAHGGQVLLSSATRTVIGTELAAGVRLSDLGEVRLAGFDEPERLFQVVAEGLGTAFPEPRAPRPWRDEQPALLERAEELAMVDAAVASAQSGAGRLVVIEGSAGIGKTSLLAEGRARAAASGLTVLYARASELEAAFSFGIVRQLFEPAVATAGEEERSRVLAGAATQAARLFTPDDGGERSEEDVYALLHGLYWLTVNLAESRPLALAIDDLQWSDAPSLRWLAYLARRLEGVPVCLLATFRPVEDEHPLLTELLADTATAIVRPNALSAPSVADLVQQELGADAEDAFCLACHHATGGNPLLLLELLRTLTGEDVPPVAASVPVVERLAPDAVTRSVRLRLGRLPAEATRLARAVAVLGDRAEREQAASLAGLERRQVAPAAAALARVDLLRPEPPFSFVHPLVRNAVYEAISSEEREAEHAHAAELLSELGAAPEPIAAQLLLAPPESVPRAVKVLREAARRAAAEAGLDSAARYLTRALDEPVAEEERGELLLELAAVEANLGVPALITHLRDAGALLRAPERRAEAALALGHALYWAGEEEHGVEVLERALAERPELDVELRHRLEAELIVNATRLSSQYERARERLARIEVSLDEGPGARLLLLAQAYHEAVCGGDAERAAATALAALTAMSDEERARNYTAGAYTLLYADRLDEGIRLLDTILGDVRRRGAVFHFSSVSMTRAIFEYAAGALVEAEADGRAALEALPHRNVWFRASAHGWLAQILVERGSIDEAEELLDRGEVGVAPDAFWRTPLVRGRALAAAARGDHHAALAHALELGQTAAAFGHTNPPASYPAWRSLAALAYHALGDTQAALALVQEEVDLARSWGAPRTLGRSLRILGLIQGGDDGIERIREAVAVLEPSPARLEHAYALADLGAALRRANHRAEAREHLRQALELAQQSGATLLAEQAHEELIAAGARPRRIVQTGAAALTPSERRIAAMAAEGLSNREIAQALFVTLRTVEMHLSNAFRKLDVSSRTQLPAALAEREVPVTAGA